MVRKASNFKLRDVTRAAKAMKLAGLTPRVDILQRRHDSPYPHGGGSAGA